MRNSLTNSKNNSSAINWIQKKLFRDLFIQKTFGPVKITVITSFLFLTSSSFFTYLSLSVHFHVCLSLFSLSSSSSPALTQNTLKKTVGLGVGVGVFSVSCWCGVLLVSCGCVVCVVWHAEKPPCVSSKRLPSVHSTRPRVYRHHVHMCFNMCAWCRYTWRRFERTHGRRFERTHGPHPSPLPSNTRRHTQ